MSLFEKFARKHFEEALDLARARRAFEAGDYPQAVFYAQQCAEKGARAMLEARRRRVVLNHGPELISAFVEAFESEWGPELDDVVGALEYLMEYYTRARYPFVLRGEVVSPSEIVTREVDERGLYLAERALRAVGEHLRRRGIVSG
jgi:HEPN domain-containing protein